MAMMMYCCAGLASEKSDEVVQQPSLAMLEFLAELEWVDGKWMSPLDMQDEQNKATAKTDSAKPGAANASKGTQTNPETKKEDKK